MPNPLDTLNDAVFDADSCHSLTGYDCDYIPKNADDFDRHIDEIHGGK